MKKILVIPSTNELYDIRMASNLSGSFNSVGIDSTWIKKDAVSKDKFNIFLKTNNINILFVFNGIRNEFNIDKNVRFISWIQDVFIGTENELLSGYNDGDIIYTITDPDILGFTKNINKTKNSCLLVAANKNLNIDQNRFSNKKFDISLLGFIPENDRYNFNLYNYLKNFKFKNLFEFKKIIKKINQIVYRKKDIDFFTYKMSKLVTQNYEPLTGSLDILKLENIILNNFKYLEFNEVFNKNNNFINHLNYYVQTYPRKLDRLILANSMIKSNAKSIGFFGKNWDQYPDFKKYSYGHIDNLSEILTIFRNSDVNVHNNNHGLGITTRTLESMIVGGYIMTHKSVNDYSSAGILSYFKAGEHFNFYDVEDLENNINYWINPLRSNNINNIKNNARNFVINYHLWEHRALKVINDL
jgi:hypothetical protein